jgi:predicted Zn-dependent protease
MTPQRPQDVVERALEYSRADGCVVLAEESSTVNLRWAGSTLTTNGDARGRSVTVIATIDGSEGTAAGVVSRSGGGGDDLEDLVRRAEQAARDAGPAEDAAPLVAGSASADWADDPDTTSAAVFADLAPGLGAMFERARADGIDLFGYAEHDVTSTFLGSSTGLRRRQDQPAGRFEITAKSADWSRSTWAGRAGRDFGGVDLAEVDTELRTRLGWAERRVDQPAGRYDTILPPGAVADLMVYLYWTAAARDALDGRTVFSRPGGGTRVGDVLSERPLTLLSDPRHPGLECAAHVEAGASGSMSSVFDNGLPLERTQWIADGRLESLVQTRHSAGLSGLPVTPAIDNLVLEVDDAAGSLEDVVARTERGLLLTCLWYIREVDPQTLLLTGLTRDGVYLVEGGEVVGAVNNFRFNESPVDLLGRLGDAGATVPTLPREWGDYFTRAAMPPLLVKDFNMSTVSQAS